MPDSDSPVICSECDREVCGLCGACPCDEQDLWVCRTRYEHWRYGANA
ncbi:hypothetical protein [Streptomyces sp. NPDC096339]